MDRIRRRDLVQLWARAAGLCSHPDCRKRLVLDASPADEEASIGEAAHIIAHAEKGPRGARDNRPGAVNAYPNLILLCSNHHAMVDGMPDTYSVETLQAWKAEHESWIEAVTAGVPANAPWTVFLHEDRPATDLHDATAALGPQATAAGIHHFCANVQANGWDTAAHAEWDQVTVSIGATPLARRRFAVFSTARIPLAVQLGYALGDRSRVQLFQYDRDRSTWTWDPDARPRGPRLLDRHGMPRWPPRRSRRPRQPQRSHPTLSRHPRRLRDRHPRPRAFRPLASRSRPVDRARPRLRAGPRRRPRLGLPPRSPLLRRSRSRGHRLRTRL